MKNTSKHRRTAKLAEFKKTAGPQDAVMYSAPKRNLFQRNVSDPVSHWGKNVGHNFANTAAQTWYRLGLGSDSWYSNFLDWDRRWREEENPLASAEDFDKMYDRRLFGDPSAGSTDDRGDLYEHYASREQGPVSTGIIGRAFNASQPLPEELYDMESGGLPVNWNDYSVNNRHRNAVPGMAGGMELGAYFLPGVGIPLLARDFAQEVGDGNYGHAFAYAAIPAAFKGVQRFLPKALPHAKKALDTLVGVGTAMTVPRDVARDKYYEPAPEEKPVPGVTPRFLGR